MAACVSGFSETRIANPAAGNFTVTANDSPSPWGEGRDEGGRSTHHMGFGGAGGSAAEHAQVEVRVDKELKVRAHFLEAKFF